MIIPGQFGFNCPSGFRWEDFFRNQPIRNKNGLWQPCLLTNWNEMSNLYREPAIYRCNTDIYSQNFGIDWLKFRNYGFISFQYEHVCLVVQAVTFLAHLAKGNVSFCHHRIGTKWAIFIENLPSIDASYQVSVHLAKRFQRRGFVWWSRYWRSSIKNAHFVLIGWQTWPPQAILVSDWLISKKSSLLKEIILA
jgi:hypothetical protein